MVGNESVKFLSLHKSEKLILVHVSRAVHDNMCVFSVCVSVRRTLKSGLSLDVVQALGLNNKTADRV